VEASAIFFAVAILGIFTANGVRNGMRRLLYNRSGRTFRFLSERLVREYCAQFGKDRHYWAYVLAWLAFSLGAMGFAVFAK